MLSDEEKKRFAEYLQAEIASDEAIISQMEKMPGMAMIIKPRQVQVGATKLVLKKLLSWESQKL